MQHSRASQKTHLDRVVYTWLLNNSTCIDSLVPASAPDLPVQAYFFSCLNQLNCRLSQPGLPGLSLPEAELACRQKAKTTRRQPSQNVEERQAQKTHLISCGKQYETENKRGRLTESRRVRGPPRYPLKRNRLYAGEETWSSHHEGLHPRSCLLCRGKLPTLATIVRHQRRWVRLLLAVPGAQTAMDRKSHPPAPIRSGALCVPRVTA